MKSSISGFQSVRKLPTLFQSSSKLLDTFDLFLFDCDGVVWKGGSMVPGADRVISTLRRKGKQVLFVTNNSIQSRSSLSKKFKSFGIEVPIEGYATAAYLLKYPMRPHQKALVLGHQGVLEEFELLDIPHIAGKSFDNHKIVLDSSNSSGLKVAHDSAVGAVVVGVDTHFNYFKLQYAQLCLNQNEDCRFLATNDDAVAVTADTQWVETRAMVGAIRGCTHIEPIIVGKPAAFLLDLIIEKYLVTDRERVCMVGDSLRTDVLFGQSRGVECVLVLSGVTRLEQLMSKDNVIIPEYYCDSIADLIDC